MLTIEVHPDRDKGPISPMIYGQMVEHAYWSVHLGLWAQMLDNGGFEMDRDRVHARVAQGWKVFSTCSGNAVTSKVDDDRPYNAKSSQKISVTRYTGGEVRLLQNGLHVTPDVAYTGFIFLRGHIHGEVSVCLLSGMNVRLCEHTLERIDHDAWRKYPFSLKPTKESPNAAFVVNIRGEGDLWLDQAYVSPADTFRGHGTRADIVQLYQGLKPAFIRWPGGTYLIWHHWKSGIGPLEDRYYGDGRRLGNAGITHAGEWDPNTFGTDEFIQFCRDLGSEPMINVNIKDGLQNTLDWIEYCNGAADTHWGKLRATYGHPEPYNVRYWVVDNEPLVRSDQKALNGEVYPIAARAWAQAMKEKDPGMTVLIMGDHDMEAHTDAVPAFSASVIKHTADYIDRLCVHCYYDQTAHAPLQGMPYKLGESIGRLKEMIDQYSGGRDVKVALSEWNPESGTNVGGNMGQALEAAQIFHMLERKSADGALDMATPCQLCVNVDRYRGYWLRSALVQITNSAAWTSPMYHVNRLYAQLWEPRLVETTSDDIPEVRSQAFTGFSFPALDVVAATGGTPSRIVIKAVNNTDGQAHEVRFVIRSVTRVTRIRVHEVCAETIHAMNTQFSPNQIVPVEKEIPPGDTDFACVIKPYSVSVFEVSCA
jgi:alpha-N-arabinofuranosidase